MNRLLVLLIAIACVIMCRAEEADLLSADSVAACNAVDSVHPPKREIGAIRKTIRGFSKIDNRYIEPQHYNWAFMVQSTFNY
ncbi:MAG: hypothetical protein J6C65_00515, partial [Prevotella sp.]|nr:hypothetical protein [Prevotella sp.]